MRIRADRLAQVGVGALALLAISVWGLTGGTRGGWTSAQVGNDSSSVGAPLVSIDHAYAGSSCSGTPTGTTPRCAASAYPDTVPATGSAGRLDRITNTGTVAGADLTTRARVAGCGPVQLANAVSGSSAGAMLPRVGTTFASTSGPVVGYGSVALDGSTGYASSVGTVSEPTVPALIGTANYGLGIWFRTSSTTPGALFGLGSDPLDRIGTNNDRILYLDGAGRIGFVAATGLGNILSVGVANGVSGYNDNAWHFAYVAITVVKVITGVTSTVTLMVDGKQVSTKVIIGLVNYQGYWHVGWSPVNGTGRYFAGSLSGFVVDSSGNAPTVSGVTSNPTSYLSFAPNRTNLWQLDDSGGAFDGSTATGILPTGTALPGGATAPCASVDMTWQLTAPSATVTTSTSLSTMVGAGWTTVSSAPDPGATQNSTITLRRNASFATYSEGLILYAPLQLEYSLRGTWATLFTWATPAPGSTAGSTFGLAS